MKKEYLDNKIVKSLLDANFSEEYIEKAIANGDIKIEKSEDKAARGDHESETKEEEDIDKLEKEAVKKEEKVKKDEKNTAEDKNAEGEMMKSMESMIMKSVGSIFNPIIERMAESLDNLSAKMDKFGQEAPKFRSEGLDNMSAIQKSMNFEKDDNGKIELNIINQRPMVAKMIEKALTNESDDSIRKSLEADALNYMTNPYAETVGEELARYMYTKNGIKFVK